MSASSRAAPAIYLDHAAATPLDARVAEVMQEAGETFANPSSPHAAGRRARAVLEDARERIVALLGGRTTGPVRDRLVFTSGATEANRLGILGSSGRRPGTVLSSPRDHGSVAAAARDLVDRGWTFAPVGLDADGTSLAQAVVAARSASGPVLICTTPVCGQTGIRETPSGIVDLDVGGRVLVHADATQAVAWEPLAFGDTPLTSLACAPHKFGGPRGIGGLVVRGGVALEPLTPGPQELGLRGGTEPVSLAVGFATALELAVARRLEARVQVAGLRDAFDRGILSSGRTHGIDVLVVGREGDRAPHVSTISIRGVDRQTLVMACDLAGVCLATGTACASGSSDASPAIVALGLAPWVAQGAIRASFACTTTAEEIDEAVRRIDGVFRGLATMGLQGPTLAR